MKCEAKEGNEAASVGQPRERRDLDLQRGQRARSTTIYWRRKAEAAVSDVFPALVASVRDAGGRGEGRGGAGRRQIPPPASVDKAPDGSPEERVSPGGAPPSRETRREEGLSPTEPGASAGGAGGIRRVRFLCPRRGPSRQ